MSIQTERQQASRAIAELYQDSFFIRYWATIGHVLGRKKPVSIWVSAAVVMGANLLLGVAISSLLGETRFTTRNAILVNLMYVTYTYFAVPILIHVNTRLVEFLRSRLVNSLKYERDIDELLLWANQWIGRQIPQLLISLGFGLVVALIGFYGIYPSAQFSFGQVSIYFINFFHVGAGFYGLLSLLVFILRLQKWDLVLYEDDPASSPILLQLSKELRDYILAFASTSALLYLLIGLIGALTITITIGTLIIIWIPILALFILGNQAFSVQIVKVKYERLEKLQSQIMKLSHAEKIDKDTVAYIKSLIDYHDRVKSSKNSLYNSEAFINLLGSLALPSLAFILNAIDAWQKLFGKP